MDTTQRCLPISALYEQMILTGSPDELCAMKRLVSATKFIFDGSTIPFSLLMQGKNFAEQLQTYGLLRLPYDECLFQIGPFDLSEAEDGSDIAHEIIIAHQDQEHIYGRVYLISSRQVKPYFLTGSATFVLPKFISLDDWYSRASSFTVRDRFPAQTSTRHSPLIEFEVSLVSMKMMSGYLFAALGCLNSDGIESEPIPEKKYINIKRMAANKPPIFGYRLLTINASKVKMPGVIASGNHHASPRLHWRRGHIRRQQTGKLVVVRPCLVGDYSKGQLIKDYAVKSSRHLLEPASLN